MCILCMAMQMTIIGRLGASTRKLSHADSFQTIKHLPPPLIIDRERLEHCCLLLSTGGERVVWTPDLEEHILDYMEENPGVSKRREMHSGRVTCCTYDAHMTVWRVLHEQLLCFYHLQEVQCLMPSWPFLCFVSSLYRQGGF
jgi:hypothetical protein